MICDYLASNFYLFLIIILFSFLFFVWLFIKFAFFLVCMKYKCKITFKFNRFHQLANIHIIKLADDQADDSAEFIEIFIDKLWFSSCYFNKSITNRLMVCFSGLRINYYHPNQLNQYQKESNSSNIYFRFLMWLIYLFFKYFGSIYIEQLNVKLFNLFNDHVSAAIKNTQHHSHLKFRTKTIGAINLPGDSSKQPNRIDKSVYLNLNFDLFRIEFNQMFQQQPNEHSETEFKRIKYEHDSELVGFRTLQFDWNNFHLKYLKQSTSQQQQQQQQQADCSRASQLLDFSYQSIVDVLVRESRFRLLLDKSFNRNQYKTSKNRLDTFMDQIYCAQFNLNDTKCLINKFNSNKSYFTDLNYLVDLLNNRLSQKNNLTRPKSNDLKRIFSKAISKVQLFEINNFEATCVVYKSDMIPRSTSLSQLMHSKQEKIKLDTFCLLINKNQSKNDLKPDFSTLVYTTLRNLHYYKSNRFNYSLLNRLSLSLNRIKSDQNEPNRIHHRFDCTCENANLYLHLKLLKDLMNSNFFSYLVSDLSNKTSDNDLIKQIIKESFKKKSNGIILDLKLISSYIHLIELTESSSSSSSNSDASKSLPKANSIHSTFVYSIGSKYFNLKYSSLYFRRPTDLKLVNNKSFQLNLIQSILFKSTKSIVNSNSKNFNPNHDKFTNYLFEDNLTECNLNKLFDSISSTSLKLASNNHRHYWGLLFNLNSLDFKYESNQTTSNSLIIHLLLNSIHIEYSASFFKIIDQLITSNSSLIDKIFSNMISIKSPTKLDTDESMFDDFVQPSIDIRFNIQSFHAYLFFERLTFFYLKLNQINYQSITKSNESADNSGFCLLIQEINLLQLKIDDSYLNDLRVKNQQKAATFSNDESYDKANLVENHENLNYFLIYDYLESSNTNYNLVLLVKSLNLNSHLNKENLESWLLTIQDVMCTWSFQTHFILFDALIQPISHLVQSVEENFHFLIQPPNLNKKKYFDIKILLESDVLINFLFDYSQDSSKLLQTNGKINPLQQQQSSVASTYSSHYFANQSTLLPPPTTTDVLSPPSPYIQTVSIILIDVYCRVTNSFNDFELTIGDVSMYVNVDDQNIYSLISNNMDPHDGSVVDNCEALNEDELYERTTQTHSQRQFFHASSFTWTYGQNDLLKEERELLALESKTNKLSSVSFDLFHINFIFKYDFAKLIDHILNLRKCFVKIREQLYRNNSSNYAQSSSMKKSLSCDIQIKIDLFKFTLEDDPFEVKLSYNYTLMADEHLESVKRRQTLDQRKLIKEQKLEQEALELLREHESKIYLQRSKMIYKKTHHKHQVRTELFTIYAESLKFHALADLRWHERQQCYNILREIDHNSPPPPLHQPEHQKNPADCYSILWCRHINLTMNVWKFQFRDYTQPLVMMKDLNLFGRVVGGEYQPAPRSRRELKISIGSEFKNMDSYNFTIQRSMSPFKFYHDLCCNMSFFSFAYGPNMEGSMAQLNLSLDKIIHPPRDPSRAMPWWDKSRLYLHGRITSSIAQAQIIYHVSMDPYNRTEEMKLVWFNLYYDWTNMHMLFKGPLDVYLNTESKYDDCRLLHLPNLELNIDIDWICKAQSSTQNQKFNSAIYNPANAHNYVFPCAPDKLPAIINSCEHDSYAQFRSDKVNLTISFVCKLDNDSEDLPVCKLYASTSRFLQKIKNLLSAITRPTRRGRLFMNLKPRKTILSRHFKVVNFHLDIPRLNIHYWSSASEEYGLQLECDHFRLNSTHSLELIPFMDQLKRRPRPCWSIDLMKFSLAETTIYLMSPQLNKQTIQGFESPNLNSTNKIHSTDDSLMNNQENQVTRFLDRPPAIRNFFLKIDSIFYEREKAVEKQVLNESTIESFKENPKLKKNNSMIVPPNWSKNFASSALLRSLSVNNGSTSNESTDRYPIESTQLIRSRKNRYDKSYINKKSLSTYKSESSRAYGSILENENIEKSAVDLKKLNESISSSSTFLKLRNKKLNKIENIIRKSRNASQDRNEFYEGEENNLKDKKSSSPEDFETKSLPKHNIKIRNLKAKWNNVNRDVIFTLYEIYNKAKRLRHNLSSQALKNYDSMINDQLISNLASNQHYVRQQNQYGNQFSRKPSVNSNYLGSSGNSSLKIGQNQSFKSSSSNQDDQNPSSPLSPKTNHSSNNFFDDLLNKLDSERDSVVYCDENKKVESNNYNDMLYGVHSVTKQSDVLEQNIYIEFINSQIKLSLNDFSTSLQQQSQKTNNENATPTKQNNLKSNKMSQNQMLMADGPKDEEYIIISAAKANVIQRIHKPVWKSQRLLDKISWTGNLESMQYFATLKLNEPKISSNVKSKLINEQNQSNSENDSTNSSVQKQKNEACKMKYLDDLILDEDDEYWLSDRLIDLDNQNCVIKNSSSNSCHKKNKISLNKPNNGDQQLDVSSISSVSSNESENYDLALRRKLNSNRNRLGMLISYQNKSDTNKKMNQEENSKNADQEQVTNESLKSSKKRNLARGLILLRRGGSSQPSQTTNQSNNRSSPNLFDQKSSSQLFNQQVYLQLVVSKCRCEFYIIDYEDRIPDENEKMLSSNDLMESQSQLFHHIHQSKLNLLNGHNSNQIDLNASFNEPIDCFTLIHHDMNLCCNSQQYKMIMDIVNNLVLYFRPRRKQVLDQQRSIKFNLQLSMGNLDSLKQHIQSKQAETKEVLCKLRMLERKLFHLKEKIENEISLFNSKYGYNSYKNYEFKIVNQLDSSTITNDLNCISELKMENLRMEMDYNECKKMLNQFSNELNVLISCYKELMLEKRAFSFTSSSSAVSHQFNLLFDSNNSNSLGSPSLNNYYFASLYGHHNYQTAFKFRNRKMPQQVSRSKLDQPQQQQQQIDPSQNRKIDLNQQAQESIINNEIGRRYEIWFKHIQWKLNDDDGQTGCARFLMKNLIYTKVTSPNQQELDSVEHNLEVESCKIQDLSTPLDRKTKKSKKSKPAENSVADTSVADIKLDNYVITSLFDSLPMNQTDEQNNENDDADQNSSSSMTNGNLSSLDRISSSTTNQMMFRIFCKERPPVGIPVIEHLELNLSPLVIKLTNRFYKMMIKFFFEQQQTNSNPIGGLSNDLKLKTAAKSNAVFNGNTSTLNNQRHAYRKSTTLNEDNLIQLNLSTSNTSNIQPQNGTTPSSMSPNSAALLTPKIDRSLNASAPVNTSIQSPIVSKGILQKKASQTSLFNNSIILNNQTNSTTPSNSVLLKMNADSSVNTNAQNDSQLQNEDIEIMKQRSANNNTFLCIKIPEIQLLVSYKGNKEKNIKDLTNVSLLFPLFEVHDKTWTWLDLINALKSHVKKALVSQALKHKLIKVPIKPVNKLINRGKRSQSNQQLTNLEIDEHEKMTILKLFGAKLIEKKSIQPISPSPPLALPSPLGAKFPPQSILNGDQQLMFHSTQHQQSVNNKHLDDSLSMNNSLLSNCSPIKQINDTKSTIGSVNYDDESANNESGSNKNKKNKLQKSNSTLSFNLKKRFLKFKSEKSTSNLK